MPIKTFDLPLLLQDSTSDSPKLGEPTFDENIPTLELQDLDQAFFDHFDKAINAHIVEKSISKKVPVIFATGERWALVRQRKALRDSNGTLILPLITIRRLNINREPGGTELPPANPALKSLIFKVKRSPRNSNYQNLRNSVGLTNQNNVGVNIGKDSDGSDAEQGKTSRRSDAKAFSGTVFRGKQLKTGQKPEIVDVYQIPYPDFYKVEFEVSIWTQYQTQMNMIKHTIFNKFEDFSIDTLRIKTDKGYYFVAFAGPNVSNENNTDEFTDNERIIRTTISFEIPAYSIQSKLGEDHVVHKYTSQPQIAFSYYAIDDITDLDDLSQKNPLGDKKLIGPNITDIEDLTDIPVTRPRKRRKTATKLSKKIAKRRVGETSIYVGDLAEIDKFFK